MIKYSLIVLLGINTMLGQSEDKIMHTVTCMGISAATYTFLRNKKQPELKISVLNFSWKTDFVSWGVSYITPCWSTSVETFFWKSIFELKEIKPLV